MRPVVEAVSLVRSYRQGGERISALDDVSLVLGAGTWTSIVGASGSGKTTLLHCLAGLERPQSGRVLYGGRDIARMSASKRAKLRRSEIGLVFQSFNLVPVLDVRSNILLPLRLARRRVDKAWFHEVVANLGIGDRLSHLPGELSGGQQQRVAIARALLPRPALILADEPTGNLDSSTGGEVLDLFRQAVVDHSQALVLVTHDEDAARRGDRIVRIADGRICSDSAPAMGAQTGSSIRELG